MKKNYVIKIFVIFFLCFSFNFSYSCKLDKWLRYNLASPMESVFCNVISYDGSNIFMNIKNGAMSSLFTWDIQHDRVYSDGFIPMNMKELKCSSNELYLGINWGHRLEIQKKMGLNFAFYLFLDCTESLICGFDISDAFDGVVCYDNFNNIKVYNLRNGEEISSFKEYDSIKSVRFITQNTGKCFLVVETLFVVKFYDILTFELKSSYKKQKNVGVELRILNGICIDEGHYAAFSSMVASGLFETEIYPYILHGQRFEIVKLISEFTVMNAPQYTADPDVILLAGRRIYGSLMYEQVNLFSISRKKQIKIKLFAIEDSIAYEDWVSFFAKLLVPEFLEGDEIRNGRLLNAQFTNKNQLILFLKSSKNSVKNQVDVFFLNIDFDSEKCVFQLTCDEKHEQFALVSL